MRIVKGNLWDHYNAGAWLVVTTNVGWDPDTFANNMGAGVALQAVSRWPSLASWYGKICARSGSATSLVADPEKRLFFFPVKPLIFKTPELSWNQKANLILIRRSARALANAVKALRPEDQVVLGFPGCGNGGLSKEQVLPILDQFLVDPRFTIVDLAADADEETTEIKGKKKFLEDVSYPVFLEPGDPTPESPLDRYIREKAEKEALENKG